MKPWCVSAILLAIGCGAAPKVSNTPASAGFDKLIVALESDQPTAAYAMLTRTSRQAISYEEFRRTWQHTKAERAAQAKALRDVAALNANAGEQAVVRLKSGQQVTLQRVGNVWSLDQPTVGNPVFLQPNHTVAAFASAVESRNIEALLATLTKRRQAGIARQLEGFLKSLAKHANDPLSIDGPDRRTLRWEESQVQYEVVLRLDGAEWRIDDIVVRDAPAAEEAIEADVEGDEADW